MAMKTLMAAPSRLLWAGVASATLLATLRGSASQLEYRPSGLGPLVEEVEIHGLAPGIVASTLLSPWRGGRARMYKAPQCRVGVNEWPTTNLTGIPGFHRIYDRKYLDAIVRSLCWKGGKQLSELTIADLACILAEALESGCEKMYEPVEPLVLLRAEFYRFLRAFGGSKPSSKTVFETSKTLKLPAAAQALGMLSHWATIIYVHKEKAANRSSSFNLALDPAVVGRGGSIDDFEFYEEVWSLVRAASSNLFAKPGGGQGGVPLSVVTLISAAAAIYMIKAGKRVDYDALMAARLTYNNTVTLQWASPLPAASLAIVLRGVEEDLREACGNHGAGVYDSLRRIILLQAGRFRDSDDSQRVGALRNGIIEYSHYMVEYSSTLAAGYKTPELAYAAARVMYSVSDVLSRAKDTRLRDLARDASCLYAAASEAAKLEPGVLVA